MKTTYRSKYMRILDLLRANGEATNAELNGICYRYGARIKEMREAGHIIVTSRQNDTCYRYIYMGQRDEDDQISLLKVD